MPDAGFEQRFFDLSIDMLCVLHFSGRFIQLNTAWESTLGFTRDELMSRMRDIFEWLASGRLKIRIGHEFPLADASRAHEELEARRTTGKVLLM